MKIAGYLKTSLIEWPGKIASVIFVPGCNFRCPFCHNRDLVRNSGLKLINEKQIFADLEKRKKWVDGVVITGGECTLLPDLPEFLDKLKKMGFLTMIETNGSRPEVIASLLHCSIADFVAMDVKGPLEEYERFTKVKSQKSSFDKLRMILSSVEVSKVKSSVEIILKSGVDFEFRTTVVPGLHDKEVLLKMATELKKITEDCKLTTDSCRWFLQNFQPKNCLDPEFEKRKPFAKAELENFLKAVQKILPQTELRGVN